MTDECAAALVTSEAPLSTRRRPPDRGAPEHPRRRISAWRTVVASLVVLTAILFAVPGSRVPEQVDTTALRDAVTVDGIREHQRALQSIAEANGGVRAIGTPGYAASLAYVRERLEVAGYRVEVQRIRFPFYEEYGPPQLERTVPERAAYRPGTDVRLMTFSGSGDVTAPIQQVDLATPFVPTAGSTSGCEAADFAGFVAGNVALLQRGTCSFADKARNARAAGAAAALIANDGQPGHQEAVSGTLEAPGVDMPVLGVSFAVAAELISRTGEPFRVAAATLSDQLESTNLIASTPGGRDDRVVLVGAHLDSIARGPGINDNGSGVSTVLEIAEQFAALGIQPRNQVRFAFWGAEEIGLYGSRSYVGHLGPDRLADIMLDLNFDMLGSPNFARFVYDGDGSTDPRRGPPGSGAVERVFTEYFATRGLPVEPIPLDGRSDYAPFVAAGIPVGGLFSGAEGIKTPPQAARAGGTPGRAFDSCYHRACDNADNTSPQALDQLGDAAADAVLRLSMSPVDVRSGN